jgi:hypothetical protein
MSMTTRGDLLTLVDGAPGRLTTLQGALTTWTHRVRAAAAHATSQDLVADVDGDPVDELAPVEALPTTGSVPASDAFSAVGGQRDDPDEVGPRPDAPWGTRRVEHLDDGPETLVSSYVAVALPDRWRVVGRGHLAVSDGQRSWAGTSTLVTERDSTRAAIHDAGAIGACLYPGALLGGLELGPAETAGLEGRPCWLVDAHPRPDASGTSLATTAAPHALRLHRDLVGVDHRIWFDARTGIVLRHEGFVDGEMCSWTALTDLVVDAPLAAEEFRPPPDAVVRSRHELLRDHLSEMGIDPDGVDLDDPAQVRQALRQGA